MYYFNKTEGLIADTEADLEFINVNSLMPGTTCIIISTSQVYMLDTNREWQLL